MKKIKTALMTLFVCALGYGSYSAYDYITMSDAERFLLQNIEALAIDESGGGDTIYDDHRIGGFVKARSSGGSVEILDDGVSLEGYTVIERIRCCKYSRGKTCYKSLQHKDCTGV